MNYIKIDWKVGLNDLQGPFRHYDFVVFRVLISNVNIIELLRNKAQSFFLCVLHLVGRIFGYFSVEIA